LADGGSRSGAERDQGNAASLAKGFVYDHIDPYD
jgi:hypothetical protein